MANYPAPGEKTGYNYYDYINSVLQIVGNQHCHGVKTFSNGIVANVTGNVTGNATTASKAGNGVSSSGTFSLLNATSTTVADANIQAGDIIILTARTATAALVLAGGTDHAAGIYIVTTAGVGFTVTHDAHASNTGATFNYLAISA